MTPNHKIPGPEAARDDDEDEAAATAVVASAREGDGVVSPERPADQAGEALPDAEEDNNPRQYTD